MDVVRTSVSVSDAGQIQKVLKTCVACRGKKRRCNAARPTCIRCVRDGEPECVYTTNVVQAKPKALILQQEINSLKAQIYSLRRPAAPDNIESETTHHLSRAAVLPGNLPRALSQDSTSRRWSLVSSSPKQPRASFDPLMGSWWTRNEPPPSGLIAMLARMFAEKEHHYTHDPRPPEFYESLYNPDPNTGLHPALRNAVFLLACGYYQGPFAQLEPLFLQRTKYHLGQSLALADRLLDYIEAYTFLTIYHGQKGR
ncbi:hypothetical protein BOTBODRAFT_477224 [Botryobasidium botryosum FD-172 SS1]|uniref:Zn(2)-C6 fungal-type domain-containing protein n=1 Tax=Botryobasidium botryosum (strain FD-172 SS1) TaxID=930990 RepID=A0A067N528_BOTB1|nr:hypothetical protein BOTBODRAFT_477224 [Botryobasidium botryosum FD-172 SS1]